MADYSDPISDPIKPLSLLVVTSFVMLVLAVGGLFTWMEADNARKLMRDNLMTNALVLTASFDVGKIAALTGTPEDVASSSYQYLRGQLIRIRDANPRYRYLYFFGRRNGEHPFFFMGTATEDSPEYSPPGQVYFEDSPTLSRVFATRSPCISPPFTDRWGTWVSALIPINHPQSGALLAVFGIDVDAQDWQEEILRRAITPLAITCLIIILMAAGTGHVRRRQLAVHIASLQQAEEALQKRNELLNGITGNIPGVVFEFYAAEQSPYGMGFVSEKATEIFGLPNDVERFLPLFTEHLADDDRESFLSSIQKAVDTVSAWSFEGRFVKPSGEMIWFQGLAVPTRQPARVVYDGVLLNITERKLAEAALRESQERFRELAELLPETIFEMDTSGKLTFANRNAFDHFGYSEEDFDSGLNAFDLISPEDRPRALENANRVMSGERIGLSEYKALRKDGTAFYAIMHSASKFSDGVLSGLRGIVMDITATKKLEEQLLQAQKMEAVGTLAGGVAHDFNNMLSAILGHAELAMLECKPSEPVRASLKAIEEAASRSADLVRQLLAFARRQNTVPKVLDLNETIAGMLKMLQRLIGEDIQVLWIPAQSLWMVKIDPSQVDQLLANLFINARDAIAGVGKITIETENVILSADRCVFHPGSVPEEYVMLAVTDDGSGMEEGVLNRIFEPFFTTKELGRGTGLGLSTVYGIVKQNDGFINVDSEPGSGSTFKIYLPRHVGEAIDQPTFHTTEFPNGNGETVLLVEDESLVLSLNQTMLERLGYSVLAAGTPAEAIRITEVHSGQIDLVITDVVMPEMSGADLVKSLREIRPSLKCLFSSGYTANVIARRGVLDHGVNFLQKPFSLRELALKVCEVLAKG